MKTKTVKLVSVQEWDELVRNTYGKPYHLQQQDGCKDRGTVELTVPNENEAYDDEMADSVPEVVNHSEMGVKFAVWLARDPKKPLTSIGSSDFGIHLWWSRNFYPDLQTVANDLHAKGVLEAGEYIIDIDW